jgi:outer membrane protein assembly factor BamD (BamD/ComL family)
MSALASAPSSALAQCDEHARLYPHGSLADDREVIAIDALVRLGRRDDAEARAARFRAVHPGSPSMRRLDRILAR